MGRRCCDRNRRRNADKNQHGRHQKSAADAEQAGDEAHRQSHCQQQEDIDRQVGDRKEDFHGLSTTRCDGHCTGFGNNGRTGGIAASRQNRYPVAAQTQGLFATGLNNSFPRLVVWFDPRLSSRILLCPRGRLRLGLATSSLAARGLRAPAGTAAALPKSQRAWATFLGNALAGPASGILLSRLRPSGSSRRPAP